MDCMRLHRLQEQSLSHTEEETESEEEWQNREEEARGVEEREAGDLAQ